MEDGDVLPRTWADRRHHHQLLRMGWMLHTATQRSAAQDANAGLKPSEANRAKRGYRDPTAASNQSIKQASSNITKTP
jgi:hypothetical protein